MLESLGSTPWLVAGGGMALGLVTGMWDKIKTLAWRVLNLAVQRIEVPTQAGHEALTAYLISQYKRSRN